MKPINNILSNGLCVISVKKQVNDLVLLSITDFETNGKVWCDLQLKKLIDSDFDIKMSDSDYLMIKEMADQGATV